MRTVMLLISEFRNFRTNNKGLRFKIENNANQKWIVLIFKLNKCNARSKILRMNMSKGSTEIKKFILSKLSTSEASFLSEDFEKEITEMISSPIIISKANNILTLKKAMSFSHADVYDFVMSFRIRKSGATFDLWPISFKSADGKDVKAEVHFNNRSLVNPRIQNELVELSNTWGKALMAQGLSRSLEASI